MTTGTLNGRTSEQVRREIELEREQLADAVDSLRAGLDQATDVSGFIRGRLPLVAASAVGAGFVLAGGIGATMRFLARRSREGQERVRVGRFRLVRRD
jgi:hypothetical protein